MLTCNGNWKRIWMGFVEIQSKAFYAIGWRMTKSFQHEIQFGLCHNVSGAHVWDFSSLILYHLPFASNFFHLLYLFVPHLFVCRFFSLSSHSWLLILFSSFYLISNPDPLCDCARIPILITVFIGFIAIFGCVWFIPNGTCYSSDHGILKK